MTLLMPLDLKTRATPKQLRAQKRVQGILTAAVALLETLPPNELTAMQVAQRAEVPVSSVYRYFPTIEDLIEELYLQAAGDLKDRIISAIDQPGGWRDRMRGGLMLLHAFLTDHPFYRALLIAMAARRGPQSLHHDFNQDLVTTLAARWGAGEDGFRGEDPEMVAAVTVQIALSLEELMMQHPDPRVTEAYATEASRALERYLEIYLHD